MEGLRRGVQLLEQRVGRQLVYRIGLMLAGPPDGAVMKGLRQTEQSHGVTLETVTPAEANRVGPADPVDRLGCTPAGDGVVERRRSQDLEAALAVPEARTFLTPPAPPP